MNKNKTAMTIAVLMIFIIAFSAFSVPNASAQGTMVTYAYIGATPNPVGVGQEVLLHVGITQQLSLYVYGWEGLTATVTKPDGTIQTLGPFRTDATGGTGTVYVPTMEGTYKLQTHFPQQEMPDTLSRGGVYVPEGTVMQASDSPILELVVDTGALQYYPTAPLPTEYWTRPIDAELHAWNTISGNWYTNPPNSYAPFNDDAPDTAHILWAKQMEAGGLAGGELGPHAMNSGDAYEGKFLQSVILGGILYYNKFNTQGRFLPSEAQKVVAVDLHTGETLWEKPLLDLNGDSQNLQFGQALYWDSFNYHGVFTYLWTTTGNDWNAYDAFTGEWSYTMEDVPSGTSVYGPNGEIYRINVNEADGWMTLWNSTRVVNPQETGTSSDGSWGRQIGRESEYSDRIYPGERGIQWNVSIPTLPGSAYQYKLYDRIVGSSYSPEEIIHWGISLKEGQEGQLLFNKVWKAPADWVSGNKSISRAEGSIDDGVITYWCKETQEYWGFSTATGDYLWGPTEPQDYLDFLGLRDYCAYGRFFSQGMSGILYCYNATTGDLLWTYGADDPYNQVLWANQWSIRPLFFTDGKIYMGQSEHSPVDPKPRGGPFVCVDIETGQEVFRADSLFRQTDWGGRAIIGDSIIATMDTYDQRIYAIGKGPSATSVAASPKISVHGSNVIVEGMVTDVSPGTKEYALTSRFPNGVPAISDANMSDWMLYVYKNFVQPSDIVGVDVTVSVLDPNDNSYDVGTTTSDANGFFKLTFTPEVPGEYTIIATFEGSGAYYGSHSETAIFVEEASAVTPEPTQSASTADLYLIPSTVGIIIAIAVVGLLAILMLRKR